MKLRTMNQIEQNIKNERKLRSRLGNGFYISVHTDRCPFPGPRTVLGPGRTYKIIKKTKYVIVVNKFSKMKRDIFKRRNLFELQLVRILKRVSDPFL